MTTDDDLVREMRRNASLDRGTGCNFCGPGADAIEARDVEIAALRSVLRAMDVSVDDGEIAAFEPIERPSPEQLDAVLRALADTEGDQ